MISQTIKTEKLNGATNLLSWLDRYVLDLPENSVLAVTSKIVAIAEGSVVDPSSIDKAALVRREADYYLPPETNKYGITLTIKDQVLIPTAGIDESNSEDHYILWPADPQATANLVRAHFRQKFGLKHFGVVITDSKTTPLRRGTIGVALAHSGFLALHDYIGKLDIYGRPLKVSLSHLADGLAGTAVMLMGEGSEQTPLVILSEINFLEWQETDPKKEELGRLKIDLADDLYGPMLTAVDWQKGAGGLREK